MLTIVPLASLVLMLLAFERYFRLGGIGSGRWRLAGLAAAVTWAASLTAITEVLSLMHSITAGGLTIAWLAVTAGAAIVLIRLRKKTASNATTQSTAPGQAPCSATVERLDVWTWILLAGVGVIVAAVLVIALVSAPNNWDSMTYHLARVEHWAQNQSVEHYRTNIIRQLYLSPLAEFIILNLRVLSGGDRLANLVQFLSMIGCLAGVSLVAKALGAGLRGQAIAVALCAAIPMGILQASSTQNDYVVALWLVCVVVFMLQLRQRQSLMTCLLLGSSLGLACLTKATAYIYAAPLVIWVAAICVRRLRWKAWPSACVIVAVFGLINAGHYARNQSLFGTPLGRQGAAGEPSVTTNQAMSPSLLASNILRNTAVHFGSPWPAANRSIESSVVTMHSWLNVSPDDKRITVPSVHFFVPSLSYHEDLTGNGLHLLLVLAAAVTICLARKLRANRALVIYLLCLVAMAVLYCGYLQWQPWASRLHLPLFVLSCPLAALAMTAWNRRITIGATMSLLALSYPAAFANASRPLIGQRNVFVVPCSEAYFVNQPALGELYHQIADHFRRPGIKQVGLAIEENTWEYPLWLMLRDRLGDDVVLEHVDVQNDSKTLPASYAPSRSSIGCDATLHIKNGRWWISPG